MGLEVSVGFVGAALESGDSGFDYLREQLDELNRLLVSAGLPPHAEPSLEDDPLELSIGGYGFLHRLRRVAAHLWAGEPLPDPGSEPDGDPIVERYYQSDGAAEPGPRFDHLLLHSDSDGFYVPTPFQQVLHGSPDGIGVVGSSYALRDELERLKAALDERYTVELTTCAELLAAARASVETGALLLFG